MNTMGNRKNEVRDSTDVALLDDYLAALVGQRLWKARLAYGDELKLHFGEPQSTVDPKLEVLQRGAFVLATRASAWRATVKSAGPPPGGATPELMAAYVGRLAATKVASARASRWHHQMDLAPGLRLTFDDGSEFELVPMPNWDRVEENDIADWELFTPDKTFVRVGPGPVWSILRSDGPIVPNVRPLAPTN